MRFKHKIDATDGISAFPAAAPVGVVDESVNNGFVSSNVLHRIPSLLNKNVDVNINVNNENKNSKRKKQI